VIYCVVPRELAAPLHEPLRSHFRDCPLVEVVVEQRDAERRMGGERRVNEGGAPGEERRKIRGASGRRIEDRRGVSLAVPALGLPRKARAHADRLVFVERIERTTLADEDLDSARIVVRIQAGDGDAFSLLYMRYFDRIYTYMRILLKDAHEAEDAAQQVFLRTFENLGRYERRPGYPFRAWLFVVAHNVARSQLSKRRSVDVVDPFKMPERRDIPNAEDELPVLDWISDRELVMLVERLPLPQRQVLLLRYLLDLSYPEIAAVLSRTQEDVRSLQSRGVRFLRTRLASLGRDSGQRGRIPMRICLRRTSVIRARRWALHG